MILRHFQLGGLLMLTGATVVLLHRSLRWYGDTQKSMTASTELEKQLEASKASVHKLERQLAELRVRGDDVQRRLSVESTELVAAQNQLEHCRGFLTACKTKKNTLEEQKKNETKANEVFKAVQLQTLRDTRAQLQAAQGACVHVLAGRLEEARQLCQSVTQKEGSNPEAGKGRK